MNTTLVIMAAGLGTRFHNGIKQLTPVGPKGQIIMDYSIHDAISAGFNRIVFVIRRELVSDFREMIGDRIEKICNLNHVDISYAYQELDDIPDGFTVPEGRVKPWGTGHALLVCKNIVNEPFAVINSDDYYGREAFVKIHDFLMGCSSNDSAQYCMAGFTLGNTLSENGGVTRGVCHVSPDGFLTDITETHDIVMTSDGGAAVDLGDKHVPINTGLVVSMNMWGLTPGFIDIIEKGFRDFLSNLEPGDLTSEYLLPTIIDNLVRENRISVKVLDTPDRWFGVTFREDRKNVARAIKNLTKAGIYTPELF